MLYKFVFAKKSYYDLVITRHVEPQARHDNEADELRGQRGGAEPKAQTVACGVPFHERPSSSSKRKKQHWQVPPVTRVRVRQRIRRWDGFMCVLHM